MHLFPPLSLLFVRTSDFRWVDQHPHMHVRQHFQGLLLIQSRYSEAEHVAPIQMRVEGLGMDGRLSKEYKLTDD